jgi:hypothetical protein
VTNLVPEYRSHSRSRCSIRLVFRGLVALFAIVEDCMSNLTKGDGIAIDLITSNSV